MLDIAQAILPRVVVIENVRGIAYREKNDAMDLMKERFDEINALHNTAYQPSIHYLNATDFGVPRIRERAFVVAFREGQRFEASVAADGPVATAWDAIGDLALSQDEIVNLAPTCAR